MKFGPIKKSAATLAITLTLLSFGARQSQAFVGLYPLGTATAIGAVVLGISGVVGAELGESPKLINGTFDIAEVLAVATAVLLTDKDAGATVEFKTLDGKAAANLGLTASELVSFNNELPEINAITGSVTSQTIEFMKTNSDVSAVTSYAHGLWMNYSGSISADSFSALNKISVASAN